MQISQLITKLETTTTYDHMTKDTKCRSYNIDRIHGWVDHNYQLQ